MRAALELGDVVCYSNIDDDWEFGILRQILPERSQETGRIVYLVESLDWWHKGQVLEPTEYVTRCAMSFVGPIVVGDRS